MSYPPLPTPTETSAPNVPSDLGAVALAIETQGLAQYAAYNTTNNPSATTLESRITAIDAQPGGTAAALDTSITTLNTSISTWTAPTSSNLATQVAITSGAPARQSSQDTTMSGLTSSLNTYEPQITTLQQQRPKGLVYSSSANYGLSLGGGGFVLITYATFTPRANAYYRVIFTGSFQTYVAQSNAQGLYLYFFIAAGTTPPTSGTTIGESVTSIPSDTNGYFPIAGRGLTWGISGTHTVSVCGQLASPNGLSGEGGSVVGIGSFLVEDIGWRYY
jgi:hypothetical protein